jgi:hypothetical protein
MSTPRVIAESVAEPFAGCRVDREAGVIRGVRICGMRSNNGRSYPWGSGLTNHSIYEGRPVNAGHNRSGGDVPPEARLGWLRNVRHDEGGPRADLHVLKSHRLAESVFEAAERNPGLYGLSHVALCKTRWSGGQEIIESIERVDSVDLVSDPATTRGLYESTNRGRSMPTVKLRALIESLETKFTGASRKRVRKWLLEADDMAAADAAMMDAEVPMEDVADDMDPDAALWTGFQAAIQAVLTQYAETKDAASAVKAIGKYIKAHAKLAGEGDGGSSPIEPDGDETYGSEPTEESTKRGKFAAGLKEVTEVFTRVGVKSPTTDQMNAVASVAKEYRESVARTFAAQPAETPTSIGRHKAAPVAKSADAPPLSPTDFLRWVKG